MISQVKYEFTDKNTVKLVAKAVTHYGNKRKEFPISYSKMNKLIQICIQKNRHSKQDLLNLRRNERQQFLKDLQKTINEELKQHFPEWLSRINQECDHLNDLIQCSFCKERGVTTYLGEVDPTRSFVFIEKFHRSVTIVSGKNLRLICGQCGEIAKLN